MAWLSHTGLFPDALSTARLLTPLDSAHSAASRASCSHGRPLLILILNLILGGVVESLLLTSSSEALAEGDEVRNV